MASSDSDYDYTGDEEEEEEEEDDDDDEESDYSEEEEEDDDDDDDDEEQEEDLEEDDDDSDEYSLQEEDDDDQEEDDDEEENSAEEEGSIESSGEDEQVPALEHGKEGEQHDEISEAAPADAPLSGTPAVDAIPEDQHPGGQIQPDDKEFQQTKGIPPSQSDLAPAEDTATVSADLHKLKLDSSAST